MKFQIQSVSVLNKGFTLIELLVVMAVIAVLAGIILAGVNPIQQLARGRDSNRINAISGLGRAMSNYATVTNGGTFPAYSATWQSPLQSSGEIATVVTLPAIAGGAANNCPAGAQHTGTNVCYAALSATSAVIWVTLESDLSRAKASATTTPCASLAAYVWISTQGKAGYACITPATAPTAATTLF